MKTNYWLKNLQYPFFIVKVFFLKKKRQFLPLFCLLTFSANLFITYWFLKRRKKLWMTCACTFVLFALHVLVFVYDGLKKVLFCLGKTKSLHHKEIVQILSIKHEIKLMLICLWKFVFVGLIPNWTWKVKLIKNND